MSFDVSIWGTVADWMIVVVSAVAAGVTVWAVIVALQTSQLADKHHERILKREDIARAAKAQRLALAFEKELYLMGSDVYALAQHLSALVDEQRFVEAKETAQGIPSMQHLTLLERNTDHLDAFDVETAGELLIVVSSWMAIVQSPSLDLDSEDEIFSHAMRNLLSTLEALVEHTKAARTRIRPLITPLRDGFAPLDWEQIVQEIAADWPHS